MKIINASYEILTPITDNEISVKFICDRGVAHELMQYRFAQKDEEKFENELTFVKPCFWSEVPSPSSIQLANWKAAMSYAEDIYLTLIANGATPQEAQLVLPNSIKTEVIMTEDYLIWRHLLLALLLEAACKKDPLHQQIEELMIPLLTEIQERMPKKFDDIYENCMEWRSLKNP